MSDIVIEAQATSPEVSPKQVEERMIDVKVQEALFLEDCVVVKLGSAKAEIEKRISYEDFKAIISSTLGRREDEKIEGFHLPSNCFYFAKSATQVQISCYYQERIAEITYFDQKMKIKVPNIIISHVLDRKAGQNAKVVSSRYFCTDLPVNRLPQEKFIGNLDHNKRIWLSPFSNTYQEGNMCYGNNTMPVSYPEHNFRGLDYFYQFLFTAPFNSDLGIYALSEGRDGVSRWYETLQTIATKDEPFPYHRLRGFQPQ